ncbi:MAG: NYN domain-containing protein [Anaerolineae bacterium]|nr:NYN domain-containing protein [Anaerolineae bacterium]
MTIKRRLAVMIDADNAQAALLPQILEEVNKHGVTVIRRVYGDWTTPQLKGWKDVLHSHALQPMQQFSYTAGKNATDCSLIIDAMDIIYSADVDGICIVSSDSDYTRLATRIRESNLFVMGIGRQDTSPAFVNACDVFAYTEKLCPTPKSNGTKPTASKSTARPPATKAPSEKKSNTNAVPTAKQTKALKKLMQAAVSSSAQEDGWVFLGALGTSLKKIDPAFDPRSYGHKLLSKLVEAVPYIDTRKETRQGGNSVVYVRLKEN